MYLKPKHETQDLALLVALVAVFIAGALVASCGLPSTEEGTTPELNAASRLSMVGTPETTHFTNLSVTDLTVTDDATISDDLTVSGDTTLAGSLTIESGGALSGSFVYAKTNVITATAAYTLTASQTGSVFSNAGSTGEITVTLPAATEGLNYCLYLGAAYTLTVQPTGDDQVLHLTNGHGDRLQNTGTAGDSICIVAQDPTYWVPLQEIGTWSDAN
jgi:hypothetical protein